MISCKCITYARVHLLEEALYSFLQQDDLGDSELVIVNDYPLQTLIFEHPNVKIYNLDETFPTIGEKENYAIERCSGDVIAVWDDDDVALSNHLNNIRKYFKEGSNGLHWSKGAFYNYPEITDLPFIGNSGIVYSKKAWEKIGKSPIMNAGGDTVLMERIHALGEDKIVYANPPDEEVSWMYRWWLPEKDGHPTVYHQSGNGTDDEKTPNIIERHSAYIEWQRQRGLIPIGNIYLNPHWDVDYSELLRKYNENKCNTSK